MPPREITRLIVEIVLTTALAVFSLPSLAGAEEARSADAPGGALIYVSPSGSDEGTGSSTSPLHTINAALSLAEGGDVVEVTSGEYPPIRWTSAFQSPVTIRGAGPTKPVVTVPPEGTEEAIALPGARNLVIEGLEIRGGMVRITDHPVLKSAQPAEHITLRDDDLVGVEGLGTGLNIRNGSRDIVVEDDYIHDLTSGITCGNYRIIAGEDTGAPLVNGVTIRGNRLERFKQDAMQFADWENVVIDHNVMQHAEHDPEPAPQYHNDLIQFTGYSQHFSITNNYLSDSAQEIFIQPKFGPIDDIFIENNAIVGARDYAVQSQATTGLRFLYNTLWDSHYGMAIRNGPNEQPAATDGMVIGNIINRLGYPAGTQEDYNLIGEPMRSEGYGPHDLLSLDPSFQGAGDYSLQPTSPTIHTGDPELFPQLDLRGMERTSPPSMGAYEVAHEEPTSEEPAAPTEGSASTGEPTNSDTPSSAKEAETEAETPKAEAPGKSHLPEETDDNSTRNLLIALRLPGQRRVIVRRNLSVPDVCRRDCRVTVTGAVGISGANPVSHRRMRLRPAQSTLSALIKHGLRLTTDHPRTLGREQLGRPLQASARLVLRYVAGPSQQAQRQIYVKFS